MVYRARCVFADDGAGNTTDAANPFDTGAPDASSAGGTDGGAANPFEEANPFADLDPKVNEEKEKHYRE